MWRPTVRPLLLILVVALAACAPTPQPSGAPSPPGAAPPAAQSSANLNRPLNLAVKYEVNDLAPKRTGGASSAYTKRAFNASLALVDTDAAQRPYLAEALPQLNSDSWKVNPDSTMETTYLLRPGLTWHDGQALTAEDFVFAYQVYTSRGLGGTFTSSPQHLMEEVTARDPRTVVIEWKSPYPLAGALTEGLFEPLPKHLLETPFSAVAQDPAALDAFLSLPFWTTAYVGAGPFRVTKWEAGSSIEAAAFDGHALGRPKINRLLVHFIPDENTVMTGMLAGSVDVTGDNAIRFEHAVEMKRQWGSEDRGIVLMQPGPRHWIFVQFRPELMRTPSILDVRVRRALAHTIDRDALNEALFEGQGVMTDHFIHPQMPYFRDVDRAVAHYPFDLRRTAQLLGEVGFTRDSSNMFADAAGARFRPHFQADGSGIFIREQQVLQQIWAGGGIEMDPHILPTTVLHVNENRTAFPDLYASSTGIRETQLDIFSSAQIATAARNWAGQNRGGWASPDYDRSWDAFNTTLDRGQRNQQVVEMMKAVNDQLPGIFLYHNIGPEAHTSALRGVRPQSPETLVNWNMHEWEWK
jgi:peptide/nickel transport system substrate-binding protein